MNPYGSPQNLLVRNSPGLSAGDRFGAVVVTEPRRTKAGRLVWLCVCDCGKSTLISTQDLRRRGETSCGCQAPKKIAAKNRKHGHAGKGNHSPEYGIWRGMLARCYETTSKAYPDYGGRGITVCDRWKHSFIEFLKDVGTRPNPELSIDRYPDNNGNYEPGNVRWATRSQQQKNKRKRRWLKRPSDYATNPSLW